MGSYYTVLGAKIPLHFLSLGTYLGVIGGVWYMKAQDKSAGKVETASPLLTEITTSSNKKDDDEFDLEKMLNSLLKEESV